MLELRIGPRDLAAGWQSHAIVPFANPFLETVEASDGARFLYCIRERGSPELESLTLTLDTSDRSLRIRAGRWGNAPLYLMQDGDTLYGSWDPAKLYARSTLAIDAAARFLATFAHPYSRRTMFDGVLRLTERATARWSVREPLTIDYPDATPSPRPHSLREGADPPSIAQSILDASLQRWLVNSNAIAGAELSGGLDSGIVAASASPLRTYGILQSGAPGIAQRQRRDELIARFALRDTTIDAHDFPPLARVPERIVPWEEIYYDATDALLRLASRDGVAAMLTGIGGDEMCKLHRSEDDAAPETPAPPPAFLTRKAREALHDATVDLAPRPAMSYSSLEGLAASAPLYLHRGIWPIAPLTTPELYAFVRSLPAEWRRERRLSRELLARKGCSRAVTHPESTETFTPLFTHGIARAARPLIRELFADSHLAGLGLVDAHSLRAMYDNYCEGRVADDFEPLPLYSAAVLELTLRRMHAEVRA